MLIVRVEVSRLVLVVRLWVVWACYLLVRPWVRHQLALLPSST